MNFQPGDVIVWVEDPTISYAVKDDGTLNCVLILNKGKALNCESALTIEQIERFIKAGAMRHFTRKDGYVYV